MGALSGEGTHREVSPMSMKQLQTFMAKAQSNDSIRREVQACGKDNTCVAKVAQRHGLSLIHI